MIKYALKKFLPVIVSDRINRIYRIRSVTSKIFYRYRMTSFLSNWDIYERVICGIVPQVRDRFGQSHADDLIE